MDVVYNGRNRLLIFVSSSRKKEANIGDHLKKALKFEQRERKHAKTWVGGGHARGQKSLQNHPNCFFCLYNNLFSFRFQFYTFLKLQLN